MAIDEQQQQTSERPQSSRGAFSWGSGASESTSQKTNEQVQGVAQRAAEAGEDNMAALAISSKLAVRAAETMAKESNEFARKSFDEAFVMMRRLSEARSPQELVRLQSEYTRTAVQNVASFSQAVTEALAGIAAEVESAGSRVSSAKSDSPAHGEDGPPGNR
jgi:phasin family protein